MATYLYRDKAGALTDAAGAPANVEPLPTSGKRRRCTGCGRLYGGYFLARVHTASGARILCTGFGGCVQVIDGKPPKPSKDAIRVRALQDRILAVCERRGIPDERRVSVHAPDYLTVGALRVCIFPKWEYLLDGILSDLTR